MVPPGYPGTSLSSGHIATLDESNGLSMSSKDRKPHISKTWELKEEAERQNTRNVPTIAARLAALKTVRKLTLREGRTLNIKVCGNFELYLAIIPMFTITENKKLEAALAQLAGE
jgi:hypothetical protein